MRRCSICDHADRAQIDQALIESVPLRTLIAKHTGTSVAALHRHRQHIPAALLQAKRAEEVADADSLLSQVKEWLATCKDLFAQAKEDKSWSGAASATREVSRCLEMLGKLSGELQSGKVTINLAAIQSLNISALSDEQLETLYIRLQEDERLQRENPRTMTDEEIEATLQRIALGRVSQEPG